MPADRTEIVALIDRLRRLERQYRRLKIAIAVACLGAAALSTIAWKGAPRTVEAEQIIIRDGHGRARIVLGTPQFSGAAIGMQEDQPAIWLTDGKGHDRAILTDDGLDFADSREMPVADFDAVPGSPVLRLYNDSKKVIWQAPPF